MQNVFSFYYHCFVIVYVIFLTEYQLGTAFYFPHHEGIEIRENNTKKLSGSLITLKIAK